MRKEDDSCMRSSLTVRLLLASFALLLGIGTWWHMHRKFPGLQADFVVAAPLSDNRGDEEPVFLREVLNPEIKLPMVHAGTLVETENGTLRAVWFGGTAEGDKDVFLYTAEKKRGGAWSEPQLLIDRESVINAMQRHVVSLGNPLLISDGADRLSLLFVTISAGRWSGSSINIMQSEDSGNTWSSPRKLALGPFFNLSDLPRNPPLPLASGDWMVPIYHEFIGKFPQVLRLSLKGKHPIYAKSRMFGGLSYLQPTISAVSPSEAIALYRDFTAARRTFRAESRDGGRSWSAPEATELPNPDAAVCVLRLNDGRLLCAFNDSDDNRHVLRLAVSDDLGRTWRRVATLDEGDGRDVCYPYMIQGADGRIRMLYTFRGRQICYVEFNMAWLASAEAPAQEPAGGEL